jgi:hypothetical protein
MTEEKEQDWFFTFGCGQEWEGFYVILHGTWESAREKMVADFGTKWCMQYESAEAAGIERWGYILLEVKG